MVNSVEAKKISEFLDELIVKPWIKGTEKRYWPRFAFHYTDIRNAVSILESGYLYSRSYMENSGQLSISSGSPDILSVTDEWVLDCVRFYFRPRTPTQWWAEGVRTKDEINSSRYPRAHCPVPVFFLFDLKQILAIPESRFSGRSLAGHAHGILDSADDFRRMDWQKIYHNRAYGGERDITSHKGAEIIVPIHVELNTLQFIFCRSDAERETLLQMLSPSTRTRYRRRIYSTHKVDLFFREHTYLEVVDLQEKYIRMQFTPDTSSWGPFTLRVEFLSNTGMSLRVLENDSFMVRSDSGSYSWKVQAPQAYHTVSVWLDDHIVFKGSRTDTSIPF